MIGISQALAMIDLSPIEGAFSITFVKRDGSLRTINRAQKGHKNPSTSEGTTNNFKYNIKKNGVVIVADLDAKTPKDKFRAIKIATIIKINNIQVHH